MKKLIKNIGRIGRIGLIAVGFAVALTARAQVPAYPVSSSLTNALSFNPYSLNGATNIAAGGVLNVTSQPFYLYRGRGFSLTEAFTPASSTTESITNVIQLATVTGPLGGASTITNWMTSPTLFAVFGCQGTARIVASTNFTATQVDNYQLARLYAMTNLGTVIISVDPTNTYSTVFP
jgi:hypothetical protein